MRRKRQGAVRVECLNCGHLREEPDQQCPLCTYVGWAWEQDLDETLRRQLREHVLEHRQMRVA